jgi:hypothetical protein
VSLTPVLIACSIASQPLPSGVSEQATDNSYELALRVKGMWRGYRGSQHPRPGYRRHADGFWYPRKAFGLLGKRKGPDGDKMHEHLSWCHAKYWSYRESDDTFQPYRGERRRCMSPFQKEEPAPR